MCVHAYVRLHMHLCLRVCIGICVYVRLCAHVGIVFSVWMPSYAHTCWCRYICMCMHVDVRLWCPHTHTCVWDVWIHAYMYVCVCMCLAYIIYIHPCVYLRVKARFNLVNFEIIIVDLSKISLHILYMG